MRVELTRDDGLRVWVQVPRDEAERLSLEQGQTISVRSRHEQVFAAA